MDVDINAIYRKTVYPNSQLYVDGEPAGCDTGLPLPPVNATFSKHFTDSLVYTVEADGEGYFVAAPVLSEQWYANNQFNLITASKMQFYKFKLFLDDAIIDETSLREFDIAEDSGLQHIYSISLNSSEAQDNPISVSSSNGNPLPPLFGDENYGIFYLIKSSYDGIGLHSLRLEIYDDFGGSSSFTKQLLSRSLTYGNLSELPGSNFTRPSISQISSNPAFYVIPLGGLVLLAFLFRFRKF